MLNEMEVSGLGVGLQGIESLELKLSLKFPHSYKDFLLKFNGGEPVERAIDFDGSKISQVGDYIASFYEVSEDVSYGILKNYVNHGDTIPSGMIFIADSPAGNLFLLSLRNDSYGEVYYKDHEIEDESDFLPELGILPESMVKIADSFDIFTSMLYDPDE